MNYTKIIQMHNGMLNLFSFTPRGQQKYIHVYTHIAIPGYFDFTSFNTFKKKTPIIWQILVSDANINKINNLINKC
jgi:hypothetical protein